MVMAPIDRQFPRPLPMPMPKPLPWPSQDTTVDNAVFGMLDGDGDASVSKEEWSKAGWTADRFQAFDGNGDGKVTQKEFLQARRYEREFNQKDWNGDGELSRTELTGMKFYAKVAKAGLNEAADAVGGAAKSMIKHMPDWMPLKDRFSQFDADKSGGVSKEEYMAGRRKEETIKPIGPIYRPKPIFDKNELLLAAADKKAADA